MLYFDTKPLTVELPSQAAAMYDVMLGVFNDTIWTPVDGNPRAQSRAELLARGKRVICEDHDDGYNHPAHGDVLVFTPDLWAHQFGSADLKPFPNCSISGDSAWYGNEFVRGLTKQSPQFVTESSNCAVNIVSGDYIMPDQLQRFVWSLAANVTLTNGDCVARMSNGRWSAQLCSTVLHGACRNASDDRHWAITTTAVPWPQFSSAQCPPGLVASAPSNGFTNQLLGLAVPQGQPLWLHVYPNGSIPAP
jgi:hypothetical protein